MEAIFHGVMLAFGLILPLGVQNIFLLCQGAVQPNLFLALPSVATAALCDTLLIIAAVAGVTNLLPVGMQAVSFLAAAACLLLFYWGWRSWNSTGETSFKMEALTPTRQIGMAAGVSLGNPHAILDTIGIIGVSSLQYGGSEKVLFALACIGVSWLWFLSLALLGRSFGSRFISEGRYLNRIAALCIWFAGACMLWRLV